MDSAVGPYDPPVPSEQSKAQRLPSSSAAEKTRKKVTEKPERNELWASVGVNADPAVAEDGDEASENVRVTMECWMPAMLMDSVF